jgi:hypothetical protein
VSSTLSREGSASSSGFLATLLALELPREALDAVQRSGFVLPSSSRWFSETPPGAPVIASPRTHDAAVRGMPCACSPLLVSGLPWSVFPRGSAAPPCPVSQEYPKMSSQEDACEPARLIPCTTDWPIQMIV